MCGIVGWIGDAGANVVPQLLEGMRRLEYRGYDSAGIAVLDAQGRICSRRASGKLEMLRAVLTDEPLAGRIGIGHIRWATHGKPLVRNAHPHRSGDVTVVHNGIIENFRELRAELMAAGRTIDSDTDTEVIAHLADIALQHNPDPVAAAFAALDRLQGSFAVVFLFAGHDNLLVGARRGSPLTVAFSEASVGFASDAAAAGAPRVVYLEEGDRCVLTRQTQTYFDHNGQPVERVVRSVSPADAAVDKGPYRHFMEKEIHEQPDAVARTAAACIDYVSGEIAFADDPFAAGLPERIILTGCGTAYYAALTAQYWFEQLAGVPVQTDIASELRYRDMPMRASDLLICVSQSGETADTLAACRHARAQGVRTAAVVNVAHSSLAREVDHVLPTRAGPEIGVASTKAFTCQLAVLLPLAIAAGVRAGRIDADRLRTLADLQAALPRLLNAAAQTDVAAASARLARARDVLYLGRGTLYPAALEGALKLKEITYIHAEGYAAGEMKHGPIALIDESVPVVICAPSNDPLFEKTVSALHETAARGAQIIVLTDAAGAALLQHDAEHILVLPDCDPLLAPFVYAVPMQLLAYHTALRKGTDADRPRNLAKSVTVE